MLRFRKECRKKYFTYLFFFWLLSSHHFSDNPLIIHYKKNYFYGKFTVFNSHLSIPFFVHVLITNLNNSESYNKKSFSCFISSNSLIANAFHFCIVFIYRKFFIFVDN